MIVPQAKSFVRLLLSGFVFVSLPLLVALALAAVYLDQLATHSQEALYQAAQASKSSRGILDHVTRLERAAKQYQVLGDRSLLRAYERIHEEFTKSLHALQGFVNDAGIQQQIEQIMALEAGILSTLKRRSHTSQQTIDAVGGFTQLTELARQLLEGNNRVIDQEIQRLADIADTSRKNMVFIGLFLIPTLVIIVWKFSVALSRPIRQIDAAIKTMGEGEFKTSVYVTGPQDLQYLGRRLDWLRTRLAEVEEEKAKFVRHVSHELKTPLTAIREGADLLDDGVVGTLNQKQKQVVEILVSNTSKLQQLIEDLLNFSTASLSETSVTPEPVKLDKLVYKVLTDQKLAIMSKKLKLKTKLEPIVVNGDLEMLRVILDNLLSNAVKYSPAKGKLILTVVQQGSRVRVDIKDEGPGVKELDKARIFDAFYQGENKPDGHIKGTGLGLSIVKEFIEAHGGKITVGDNVPTGAHMWFTIPINANAVEENPVVDNGRLQMFR